MEQEKLVKLVEQARQGEASAQEALLAAAQDRVYYHCKKMLKNEEDAQDAAQDVLIAVLTGLDKLREPAAFWGWVNGITANRCRHLLSAPHKEWQIPEDEEGNSLLERMENLDQSLVPEAVLDDGETRQMILDLVDALPPEQRMSVLFYYYDEMSIKQIAEAMEVSEGTVKSRLNYARKSIKSGVEEYERKGVKLYSFSPLVLLALFLRQEAAGQLLSPEAAEALTSRVLAAAASSAPAAGAAAVESGASGGTASGGAASGAAASAGKIAGAAAKIGAAGKTGLSVKVIAGIVAGALLIGGGVLGISSLVGSQVSGGHSGRGDDSESLLEVNGDKGSERSAWTQVVTGDIVGVIDGNNTLWTWGGGSNPINEDDRAASGIRAAEDVLTAEFNGSNTAILKTDGSLWMWGTYGSRGQLGNGTTEGSDQPVKVMEDVAKISLGRSFTAAIKTDGSLWMWGDNTYGQLGVSLDSRDYTAEPVKVMEGVIDVSCGTQFTMAVTEDGSLWTWGSKVVAHDEDSGWVSGWVMDGVSEVAGYAILKTDGTLWTFGIPTELSDNRSIPVKVLDDVVAVDCGGSHLAALKEDGTLWTLGVNSSGSLGNGTMENAYVPTKVMDGVADLACGFATTVALKEDGSLWASGGIIWTEDWTIPRLSALSPIELFLMEDASDAPLWTLTEKEPPEEDAPAVPSFPEAYAAYADVLEEHRELIGTYCKWYEEMGSSIRPIAFTDVYGDSTPEMIFVEADAALPWSESHLTIVTFRDGQAVTILQEDWDFYVGSGLRYTLFQETDLQPLYAYTSYYTSYNVETYYAFQEAEGALRMEPTEYAPSAGQTVLSNRGGSGMGMTVDEAAAFLAEHMDP